MRNSLLLLPLTVTLCVADERGLPPQHGIGNFGKISESLYRGAQPDAAGIESLARLGIKSIINLRMTNDVWQAEASAARASGITYTNVPFKVLGRPTDARMTTLLAVIQSLPAPVFVHCEHWCDRTGMIIACYRIRHDGWSKETALDEARKYGLSRLEHGMIDYIRDFGRASTGK